MAVLLLFPFIAGAQTRQSFERREALIDSIANPRLDTTAHLKFDATTLHLGDIREDADPVSGTFRFYNAGKEPVAVSMVSTSCGCLSASSSAQLLEAGDSAEIRFSYNPKNRSGRENRRIYVRCGSPNPAAILTVTADVIPGEMPLGYKVKMGDLALRRSTVRFDVSEAGDRLTERIPCLNLGEKPLKISVIPGLCPEWLSFRAEKAENIGDISSETSGIQSSRTSSASSGSFEILPGAETDLIFTIRPSALPSPHGTFPLILEGLPGAPSTRSIVIEW